MFICRNSEGVHAYLLKCRRGTCSSVGMLKGVEIALHLQLEASCDSEIQRGKDFKNKFRKQLES